MDLFNRKKVKELERELKIVKENFERDRGELLLYKEMYEDRVKICDGLKEQNSHLTDWCFKILKDVGTNEMRERHITIPIYTRERIYKSDDPFMQEEIIEIPSITIYKTKER